MTAVAIAVRCLLVVLFFPFSALDKILNFEGAVGQAQEMFRPRPLAALVILSGLAIEILGPLAILTGWAPGPGQPRPLKPGSAQHSLTEALTRPDQT